MAPLLSAASGAVEVEGFGPASGFEAEVHKYKVVLHPGAVAGEYGDIVTLPGLLTITLDTAGGVPILEIVTKPARGLVRGFADGRAERSEVLTAFNEVLSRLQDARPGARLAQIFPASAGYVVDYLAEDLPVRMNEAGGSTILVHHGDRLGRPSRGVHPARPRPDAAGVRTGAARSCGRGRGFWFRCLGS